MRDAGERLYVDSVTIVNRTKAGTNDRGGPKYTESRLTMRCSMQPLGDTGRRQDRETDHSRLAGSASWRCWFSAREADRAGAVYPFVRPGDAIEFNGVLHIARGIPIPQRRDRDGTVISWSVDVDGVDS